MSSEMSPVEMPDFLTGISLLIFPLVILWIGVLFVLNRRQNHQKPSETSPNKSSPKGLPDSAQNPLWLNPMTYISDPTFSHIYNNIHALTDNDYHINNSRLYYQNKLCVPAEVVPNFLEVYHQSAGHPGVQRTYALIKRRFYFPRMFPQVASYVRACVTCKSLRLNRSSTKAPVSSPASSVASSAASSPAEPLPSKQETAKIEIAKSIPTKPWSHISIAVASGFPLVTYNNGYNYSQVDAVVVLVDSCTSRVHYFPINSNYTSADIIQIFQTRYLALHGRPRVLNTDRGAQFNTPEFNSFLDCCQIIHTLSPVSDHRANGKVDRCIRSLLDYLRVNVKDQAWAEYIPFAEFTINSLPSTGLKNYSPFELDTGYLPPSYNDSVLGVRTDQGKTGAQIRAEVESSRNGKNVTA